MTLRSISWNSTDEINPRMPISTTKDTASAILRPAKISGAVATSAILDASPKPKTRNRRCGERGLSAAPVELRVLVLELERAELLHRRVGIAHVEEPVGGQLRGGELVGHVPVLHIEHGGDVDAKIRAARHPGILVEQLRVALPRMAHDRAHHVLADRAVAMSLAVIPHD